MAETPQNGIAIPTGDEVRALEAFAALVKTRANALRLHSLVPSQSLLARIDAADHVLLREYRTLCQQGCGPEASALLALHRASHIRLAAEHRAA